MPSASQPAFTRCRRRCYLRFHRRLEWPAPLTGSEQEWERSLRRGERFHLLVQQHALGMAADDIVQFCKDRMAGYKYPRHVEIRPELPKGPTGKVIKAEL